MTGRKDLLAELQAWLDDDTDISGLSSSHSTRRWREVDSNFRFPAMVNLVVVAFVPRGCSGWIGAPGREYAVQLDYHAR